ncbi:MAG TPA: S8 family peptidase [Mobilitalea sp.]|nr:S8 family peptidase [Mobilitalea sp.]
MFGEDYADLIIYYFENPKLLEKYKNSVIQYINEAFAVVHIPVSQINPKTVTTFGYSAMPSVYGLTSEASLEASGINEVRKIPTLNLRGEGIVIGVIDTGIDYTNPVFTKADGTSKVISIWDQTIETGHFPYQTNFGTEYISDQINQAIASSHPLEVVPSIDENGHGTMMAGIAVGNENKQAEFAGVAPDSELIIVKLRQAKQYLRSFFLIPQKATCFQENHIMWGVQYCVRKAQDLKKPLVICLGLGSSQGPHDGHSPLSIFLSLVGDVPRNAVVVPAGNEGNKGRHYFSNILPSIGYNSVELTVGEQDKEFSMEIWGNSPGIYSIDILSPGGEYIPRIAPSLKVNREISFIFEETTINVDYLMSESETGDQLILLRFHKISAGSWKFNVYGQSDLPLGFHIWLPMGDFISTGTYFIKPDIYTTLLSPGTSFLPITMTAYNPINNILYASASRGFTRTNVIKPSLAAPGVNYVAPNNKKEFVPYSGTSVAAAHTAGIAAMFMEWGVTKGNQANMDTLEIKNYLIAGAIRIPNTTYPNRDWGFGIVNIYNVFNAFRTDSGIP